MSIREDAIDIATQLWGEEDAVVTQLCTAMLETYVARLKPGLTPQDCGEALPTAAALAAVGAAGDARLPESFEAADLSVRVGEGSDRLRLAAEQLMAPFIANGALAFRSVTV